MLRLGDGGGGEAAESDSFVGVSDLDVTFDPLTDDRGLFCVACWMLFLNDRSLPNFVPPSVDNFSSLLMDPLLLKDALSSLGFSVDFSIICDISFD